MCFVKWKHWQIAIVLWKRQWERQLQMVKKVIHNTHKQRLNCNVMMPPKQIQIQVDKVWKLCCWSVQRSSRSPNWRYFSLFSRLLSVCANQEAHAIWQPDRLQNIWAQQAATKLDRGSWTHAFNKAPTHTRTPHCDRPTEVADIFDSFSPLKLRTGVWQLVVGRVHHRVLWRRRYVDHHFLSGGWTQTLQ